MEWLIMNPQIKVTTIHKNYCSNFWHELDREKRLDPKLSFS